MSNLVLYNEEQIGLIKSTICKGASDQELSLFIHVCEKTRLDPFMRQIFAIKRYDSQQSKEILQPMISIDGARLVAQRSKEYKGQLGPFWCGEDGVWKDCWLLNKPPIASKVGVLRKGFIEPLWGVARFDAYKQTKKDGSLNTFWAKMPDIMIAKCAEALALRKAFPNELSGLYTTEEMDHLIKDVENDSKILSTKELLSKKGEDTWEQKKSLEKREQLKLEKEQPLKDGLEKLRSLVQQKKWPSKKLESLLKIATHSGIPSTPEEIARMSEFLELGPEQYEAQHGGL